MQRKSEIAPVVSAPLAQAPLRAPFLPDICTLQAAFLLVMLGELLALALTLASSGLAQFNWQQLGLRSFLIQWIVLLSAALLCPLRLWLARLQTGFAGGLCFALVLAVTALCSSVGGWLLALEWRDILYTLAANLMLAAIFGGVVLRYLYVQQQWNNQQKAELQARIRALQARIRPHFLFNSMNSIASLIATDPDTAERLLEDLCSLFRASLKEPDLVSLGDELALCRQYLAIEAVRLEGRLQVDWQLSPAVQAELDLLRIPSLLLQPLLENAIQHGIAPRVSGGTVTVSIELEQRLASRRLLMRVCNPLPERQPAAEKTEGNQMALQNIEHRLQAWYGSDAHLHTAVEAGHFAVTLACPAPEEASPWMS
ncbi:sensor histidine kinase [Pseudomaricurvus alcaniphilus]|uniref:sensor histidine kinase n=1 Tax=Pseudomaricurvus alcaniphilus TaxID=1166482 RepID=UPI003132C576